MPVNLTVLRNILCNDYDVRPVKSAKTALLLMNSVTPDLILLDLEMPEMSGLEFFDLIRNSPDHPEQKDIPVIFVSSHGTEGIMRRPGGPQDSVAKPIDPAALLKKIDALLKAGKSSGRS